MSIFNNAKGHSVEVSPVSDGLCLFKPAQPRPSAWSKNPHPSVWCFVKVYLMKPGQKSPLQNKSIKKHLKNKLTEFFSIRFQCENIYIKNGGKIV